ncbi:glycosyltransferase [Lacrimispora sp.]|uniref:glycosyltransferase n=1 Tax=Lacrimispora sp. TaxID=2719234 RepID=UPI00345F8A45
MKPSIRLSQCMIVKNEEKNIRRALSWGKGIVCEQIVVDTGSTDQTVEIAKEMGAKVLYFPWVNDFSAAKNFAIEQAKGNWIAFLDADEYFSPEEAKKILPLIKRLEKMFYPSLRPHSIVHLLANLDINGNVANTGAQERIFRNMPNLRYKNRIHEMLGLTDGGQVFALNMIKELTIFHTGYTSEAFKEQNKEERNISMIQMELEEHPEDDGLWSYLADSLSAAGRKEEAEKIYLRIIENPEAAIGEIRKNTNWANLLKVRYQRNSCGEEEMLYAYQKAKNGGYTSPDVDFWLGEWFYRKGDEENGKKHLEQALQLLEQYTDTADLDLPGQLFLVYQQLCFSSYKRELLQEAIRYGVLALRREPYRIDVLSVILLLLKREPGEEETAEGTFAFLSKLYDLSSFKNKAFLVKSSEKNLFPSLTKKLEALLSEKEKEFLADAGEIF